MNVEELSMIGPDVDLETVDAISKKRLLAFINHFVINTSMFLNKLSKSCEHGLMSLENKIQKLETSLLILESKLNSVPGLDVVDPSKSEVPNVDLKEEKAIENGEKDQNESIVEESKPDGITLDPAYMKYVKMLQFKVPLQAVKLRMEQEGVDPLLHDVILNYNK